MKKFAITAVSALALGAAVPASAIEVFDNSPSTFAGVAAHHANLAPLPGKGLLPGSQLSELPEPEVFAMMLLGLVLIGYRSSRSSNEPFK